MGVGLFDYLIIGLIDYWWLVVDGWWVMDCWLLDCWIVEVSGCNYWIIELLLES